jgi:hypothetical protein
VPLAVQATPIPIEPTQAGPELEDAAAEGVLAVPWVQQRAEQWCWAACIQMIENFRGVQVDQCQIAGRIFQTPICCQTPEDPACNKWLSPGDVIPAYNACGLAAMLTFSTALELLANEIAAGRPVQAGLVGSNNSGHAALVCGTGMAAQGPVLQVNDPYYGAGSVYYENFLRAYGYGSWRYTWYGIA